MPPAESVPWSAAPFLPRRHDLVSVARAVQGCRGCPLYVDTTQAVAGEGPADAKLMLVGEQPGDVEDRQGHPFVGPAGRVLSAALEDAGIEHADVFLTNAVKHFKHETRGKRRIHKKPGAAEVEACAPWLAAEMEAVHPAVVVAMGATAARALSGKPLAINSSRGQRFRFGSAIGVVTIHPSAVLRAQDDGPRLRALLVEDLKFARSLAGE